MHKQRTERPSIKRMMQHNITPFKRKQLNKTERLSRNEFVSYEGTSSKRGIVRNNGWVILLEVSKGIMTILEKKRIISNRTTAHICTAVLKKRTVRPQPCGAAAVLFDYKTDIDT